MLRNRLHSGALCAGRAQNRVYHQEGIGVHPSLLNSRLRVGDYNDHLDGLSHYHCPESHEASDGVPMAYEAKIKWLYYC
jgi:hypothetical protein